MLIRRREGGPDSRVTVIAAAARTAGQAVVEQNWAGFAESTTESGEPYTLAVLGEYEVPFITGAKVGDEVYIETTAFSLAKGEPPQGNAEGKPTKPEISGKKTVVVFGKVTAIPASGQFPAGAGPSPASSPLAGKMWIMLMPQAG